jgi:hypothetical protein
MALDFFQGTAIKDDPTAERVVESLLSDASSLDNSSSFEDWAGGLGYDVEYPNVRRHARRIYAAVSRMTERLKKLLGDDYETFMQAEHEQ